MPDELPQCSVPGCPNKASPYWANAELGPIGEPGCEWREVPVCFHHVGESSKRAPVEYALDAAAKMGKNFVIVGSHKGWSYEAWRGEDGRVCWRENLGDGPEGERGPTRYWPEDPFPSFADVMGWLVAAD